MREKKELNVQEGTVVAEKPKKKKKILIAVIAVVVVIAIVIGVSVHSMTQAVQMVANTVEVEPVQMRDLSDTISLKGSIAGVSSTNVTSKAVAEITAMNVQVGDIVKEGDVLCALDSDAIQKSLTEMEKSVANTKSINAINSQQLQTAVDQAVADQQTALAAAQKALDDAKGAHVYVQIQYDNGEISYAQWFASMRSVEAAQTEYDNVLESTNRAIENAKTQVELDKYKDTDSSSKDTLTDLREQLADCEVTAPCSGVVTSVNMRVGDINTAKTTIITIEDTSSLKLVATVDEADILKLQEGMKASVTADATGDEKINGTVTRVVRVKSQGTGTDAVAGGYSVEITIDKKDLLVGMSAKAKVMIKEKGEVLAVPYDLIQYDENGKAFVLVAETNEDGSAIAVRKNIEVGEEVDYYTEITGGELQEGDMLIYDYTFSVVEGQEFTPEQMYSNQDMGLGDAADEGAVNVEVTE